MKNTSWKRERTLASFGHEAKENKKTNESEKADELASSFLPLLLLSISQLYFSPGPESPTGIDPVHWSSGVRPSFTPRFSIQKLID